MFNMRNCVCLNFFEFSFNPYCVRGYVYYDVLCFVIYTLIITLSKIIVLIIHVTKHSTKYVFWYLILNTTTVY